MQHPFPVLFWLVLGALALSPTAALADSASGEATLADRWAAWQGELSEPIDWAYSFGLRTRDTRSVDHERTRLLAEIELIGQTMDLAGRPKTAQALAEWSRTVRAMQPTPQARSPERLDLPWLLANLRHAPATTDLEHIGYCEPPDWVELWSMGGVQRYEWQPGMTLQDLLARPERASVRGSDTAAAVTPLGEVHVFGIAAWNREDSAIGPGTRVVAHLNIRNLGGTLEGDLLNQRLPRFLATRLPGDVCSLRTLP